MHFAVGHGELVVDDGDGLAVGIGDVPFGEAVSFCRLRAEGDGLALTGGGAVGEDATLVAFSTSDGVLVEGSEIGCVKSIAIDSETKDRIVRNDDPALFPIGEHIAAIWSGCQSAGLVGIVAASTVNVAAFSWVGSGGNGVLASRVDSDGA